MDFNQFDSPDPQSNKNPLSVKGDDDERIIYAIYGDLVAYENHYNNLQNKYKSLATTWVIATFIAIGYVLSGYETGLMLNIFLTVMFLCLISSVGIFLLWYLDAGIYYRLIESIFYEIIKIENRYPLAGSSHHNILKLHNLEKSPPHTIHGIFYTSFILFLLSLAGLALSLYLYNMSVLYFSVCLILIFIGWLAFIVLHKKTLHFKD